jgi:hypothetical protein
MPIFYAYRQGKRKGRATLAGVGRLAQRAPVTFWRPKAASSADKLLRAAASQVGISEVGGNNRGPRVAIYQATTSLGGTGWPWCQAFVRWCLDQAGLWLTGYRGASVPQFEAWARAAGLWRGPEATPAPGWAVVFTFTPGGNVAEHVGIVTRAVPGGVETIEGNTTAPSAGGNQANGGGVYRRTRNARYVRGYVKLV